MAMTELNNQAGLLRVTSKYHGELPPRDELMQRNSFGGPDSNPHLDKLLGKKSVLNTDNDRVKRHEIGGRLYLFLNINDYMVRTDEQCLFLNRAGEFLGQGVRADFLGCEWFHRVGLPK